MVSIFPSDPYTEGEEQTKIVRGVLCERRDPYGFWYVAKPKHPAHQGAFSTMAHLEKAIIKAESTPVKKSKNGS